MHRMDRLRRSLRDSFRRKRDGPESSKPHQWQADEEAVRAGNCAFHVKYLGCVEVFESRGMQVCEEAMKVLRASRRRPVKANLYITGDGLRVVEDDTKGLIVDQTIEKVSFCAPDRNHERGFSYICRDGTTRRWMCHGFLATKDSGERLSHAVGCAFAVCLERKQKREKECGVTMTYDSKTSTFTRSGSFRVTSMTDSIGSNNTTSSSGKSVESSASTVTPRPAPVIATKAIERPHAPTKMLERQGSFRGFSQLANHSPFKRQLSLRLNELPSNLQRTQQNNINIFGTPNGANSNPVQLTNTNNIIPTSIPPSSVSPAPPPRTQRHRLHSLPGSSFTAGGTIPEASSSSNTSSEINLSSSSSKVEINNKDLVSELCQQVTQGLSLLAANHDESKTNGFTITSTTVTNTSNKFPTKFTNPWDDEVESSGTTSTSSALPVFNTTALSTANSLISKPTPLTKTSSIPVSTSKPTIADSWMNNLTQNHEPKAPLQSKISPIKENIPVKSPLTSSNSVASRNIYEPLNNPTPISNAASITSSATVATNNVNNLVPKPGNNNLSSRPSPGMNYRGGPTRSQSLGADPFDADWAAPLARTGQTPTNPFARQQTFQVSM